MKIKFKIENGYPYLVIRYENNEWETIENILKELGLQKAKTRMGFNKGLELEYYRELDTELLNYLRKYFSSKISNFVDDINASIYEHNKFNIALFRVVPNSRGEVKILLDKYLTIAELKELINKIKQVYEMLLNLATGSVEVNITIQEDKKEV
jgi:DNA-directed RNA polymerase subunit F